MAGMRDEKRTIGNVAEEGVFGLARCSGKTRETSQNTQTKEEEEEGRETTGENERRSRRLSNHTGLAETQHYRLTRWEEIRMQVL